MTANLDHWLAMLPEADRESVEERIGIRRFCGGLSEQEAEFLTRKEYHDRKLREAQAQERK